MYWGVWWNIQYLMVIIIFIVPLQGVLRFGAVFEREGGKKEVGRIFLSPVGLKAHGGGS